MKIVSVSKVLLNPISLPGMGRSIEVSGLSDTEAIEIRMAFSKGELCVEFTEEAGVELPVINLWANPHSSDVTLFVK